jgi:hypothetical protein
MPRCQTALSFRPTAGTLDPSTPPETHADKAFPNDDRDLALALAELEHALNGTLFRQHIEVLRSLEGLPGPLGVRSIGLSKNEDGAAH